MTESRYHHGDLRRTLLTAAVATVADIFEPGSSIKPFFVAAGLVSGKYDDRSVIDTSPGFFKVGVKTIEDEHGSLGVINLATVLAKSSNVGMARLALSLEPQLIWKTLTSLGFGQVRIILRVAVDAAEEQEVKEADDAGDGEAPAPADTEQQQADERHADG